MALLSIENASILKDSAVAGAIDYYENVQSLPPRHVRGFTAFAVLGSYQRNFQAPGEKITHEDIERATKRTMRALVGYTISSTGVAWPEYDRFESMAQRLSVDYDLWCVEVGARFKRAFSKNPDEVDVFDVLIAYLWYEARLKFWPGRSIEQIRWAMQGALAEFDLTSEPAAITAVLQQYRDDLIERGAVFFDKTGAVQLGAWDTRDALSVLFQVPRKRKRGAKENDVDQGVPAFPFEEKDIGVMPPHVPETEPFGPEDSADDSLELISDAVERAEDIEHLLTWARGRFEGAVEGSARWVVLRHLCETGEVPPLRALGRKHGCSHAALSYALAALVKEYQELRGGTPDS